MKNNISIYIIAVILAFTSVNSNAQNKVGKADDLGRIILTPYVSSYIVGLPSSARRMLANKLSQIATKNGVGGSSFDPRFIITPNVTILTKDLTATAPPMTAITLEITLYIGDGIDGTIFASESVQVKGVGTNETKAYIAALKQIKPANPVIQDFVNAGKVKIVEYYNGKCDFIIKEAQTLEASNEFELAILKLMNVPEVCKECYDKCMDVVIPIYQKQIDRASKLSLTSARNAWNSGQNIEAANLAVDYLSKVDPNAACFDEATALSEEIAVKVKELGQQEWEFQLQQQQDAVDLEKAQIKASKEIGVAYGKNQPKKATYNTKGWWE